METAAAPSDEIRYKINETSWVDEIHTFGGVDCAQFDDQLVSFKNWNPYDLCDDALECMR